MGRMEQVKSVSLTFDDIGSGGDKNHVIARHDAEIRVPDEYKRESFVLQRDSDLRKAYSLLRAAEKAKTPVRAELLLGLGTTALGAFLSLVFTASELSVFWVAIVVVLAASAVGLIVAFCFCRKTEERSTHDLARRVLELLAAPKEKENPDEH